MEAIDLEAFIRKAEVAKREALPKRVDNIVSGEPFRVKRSRGDEGKSRVEGRWV